MSSFAVLLVLAAAVAHAAWNVIAHGVSRIGMPFLWLGAVSSVVVWIGVVPFTGGLGTGTVSAFLLGIVVSALLHVAYMLVLQRGYRVGRLSTVYATARGTGPTISVVLAVTLLGERPSWLALVGGLLVLVGVVAVGLADAGADPGAVASGSAPVVARPRRRIDPGIVAGLLTGVAIAAYTIWDAHFVRGGAAPVAFMVGCTAVEVVLFGALLGPRRREVLPVLRAHWGRVLAFGVLSPLSYILVLVAITIAPVALVAPMREVSVVLVSVFGALVLREGRATTRIAASVVVLAGIALLAI
ncbi:EamA family transporter [Curtobacterium pusillum]|uniref:EamA family transporter n=1 Tax=Curtobacterium pusillum TaxID=69373 RepID=UPI0011A453D6|nr:EamA family transporter [Curtobacterium pusillum]